MKDHYAMFAGYNGWANRRVYAAARALPDADYRADRGAFFGSVHRTLNHLLATDRIWMRRFTGTGDAPDRLDAIVCDDFTLLAAAREAEDARIVDYVAGLDDAALAGVIRYRRVSSPEGTSRSSRRHWRTGSTTRRITAARCARADADRGIRTGARPAVLPARARAGA